MYPCSGCGVCCKKADKAKENSLALAEAIGNPAVIFPYNFSAEGVCEKLSENRCLVYDSRPLICNVEKMSQVLKYDQKEFFKLNAMACNTMIEEAGLDKAFLINL